MKNAGTDANPRAENRDDAAKNGNNNEAFRQLCSALQFAATMRSRRTGHAKPAAEAVAERHKPYRKKFRPSLSGVGGYGRGVRGAGYDSYGVTGRPANRYVDPILVQETSRGVDYLTGYPVARAAADDQHHRSGYEDVDRPAEVWKTNVVGESKSSNFDDNHAEVNNNDEDDDFDYDDDNLRV